MYIKFLQRFEPSVLLINTGPCDTDIQGKIFLSYLSDIILSLKRNKFLHQYQKQWITVYSFFFGFHSVKISACEDILHLFNG